MADPLPRDPASNVLSRNTRVLALGGSLVLLALGTAWAFQRRATPTDLPVIDVHVGGAVVAAELAFTEKDRARGLMYRDRLGEDQGMLFVYPSPRPLSFWMRNTFIPLDIAFIGPDRRVLQVARMRPLTEVGHPSGAPAQYALEVNQGWLDAHGVGVGDVVDFALPRLMVAEDDGR